ncbi:unnamed protein product [Zymoseptoria tritici ST99CH_1A5]|uniref:C2H2 type master regulator of conidiophore development brlA n=1 Tax=Zymoseptoria tritici ST99CH_1A5 TaxID=1276529 RepID=A0A1Y6LW58_ZYMTR|nr:unnamed protein product [Zymoseptoria tritici ST99CH_1A5]
MQSPKQFEDMAWEELPSLTYTTFEIGSWTNETDLNSSLASYSSPTDLSIDASELISTRPGSRLQSPLEPHQNEAYLTGFTTPRYRVLNDSNLSFAYSRVPRSLAPSAAAGTDTVSRGRRDDAPNPNKHACFECPDCAKSFRYHKDLAHNLRAHVPSFQRPFPCDFPGCPQAFVHPKDLRRHKATHEEPDIRRRVKCPTAGCTKSFTRQDNLSRHLRVHDPTASESLPPQTTSTSIDLEAAVLNPALPDSSQNALDSDDSKNNDGILSNGHYEAETAGVSDLLPNELRSTPEAFTSIEASSDHQPGPIFSWQAALAETPLPIRPLCTSNAPVPATPEKGQNQQASDETDHHENDAGFSSALVELDGMIHDLLIRTAIWQERSIQAQSPMRSVKTFENQPAEVSSLARSISALELELPPRNDCDSSAVDFFATAVRACTEPSHRSTLPTLKSDAGIQTHAHNGFSGYSDSGSYRSQPQSVGQSGSHQRYITQHTADKRAAPDLPSGDGNGRDRAGGKKRKLDSLDKVLYLCICRVAERETCPDASLAFEGPSLLIRHLEKDHNFFSHTDCVQKFDSASLARPKRHYCGMYCPIADCTRRDPQDSKLHHDTDHCFRGRDKTTEKWKALFKLKYPLLECPEDGFTITTAGRTENFLLPYATMSSDPDLHSHPDSDVSPANSYPTAVEAYSPYLSQDHSSFNHGFHWLNQIPPALGSPTNDTSIGDGTVGISSFVDVRVNGAHAHRSTVELSIPSEPTPSSSADRSIHDQMRTVLAQQEMLKQQSSSRQTVITDADALIRALKDALEATKEPDVRPEVRTASLSRIDLLFQVSRQSRAIYAATLATESSGTDTSKYADFAIHFASM